MAKGLFSQQKVQMKACAIVKGHKKFAWWVYYNLIRSFSYPWKPEEKGRKVKEDTSSFYEEKLNLSQVNSTDLLIWCMAFPQNPFPHIISWFNFQTSYTFFPQQRNNDSFSSLIVAQQAIIQPFSRTAAFIHTSIIFLFIGHKRHRSTSSKKKEKVWTVQLA